MNPCDTAISECSIYGSVISYRCNDSHWNQLPLSYAFDITFIGEICLPGTVSGQVHMNTTNRIRLVTIAVVSMISCGNLFSHRSFSLLTFRLVNEL